MSITGIKAVKIFDLAKWFSEWELIIIHFFTLLVSGRHFDTSLSETESRVSTRQDRDTQYVVSRMDSRNIHYLLGKQLQCRFDLRF